MQDLNNEDGLLFVEIAIEDHVFWKTGNQNPSQSKKGGRTKTAECSAFRLSQQRMHCLINGRFPALGQSEFCGLFVVVRLFDD